jgi:hypothetical protein
MKKTRLTPLYASLQKHFNLARKCHPRSHVAFDPDTGEILAHSRHWKKFTAEFKKAHAKRPGIWPGIIDWKQKLSFHNFLSNFLAVKGLAQARTFGRLRMVH